MNSEHLETRTLSSIMTFFFKYIFPTAWITGFGIGPFALWSQDREAAMGFLIMWVVGSTMLFWLCAPLKRVRIAGGTLLISNYLREIAVPVDQVDRVSERRYVNTRPVTIHFRVATEFGQSVLFMPKGTYAFWKPHPVLKELTDAAHVNGA